MEFFLRLLGWAAVACGGVVYLYALEAFQDGEVGRFLALGVTGTGACYWGYLLLRPVTHEPEEFVPDEDEWGW